MKTHLTFNTLAFDRELPALARALYEAAQAGADAVACAAVLHYKKETVQELKDDTRAGGVEVRRV